MYSTIFVPLLQALYPGPSGPDRGCQGLKCVEKKPLLYYNDILDIISAESPRFHGMGGQRMKKYFIITVNVIIIAAILVFVVL